MKFNIFFYIFEILSSFIMLPSYILLIIQSINNYYFKYYKTNESIIERLLLEQFSYEVYSNINSYAFSLEQNDGYNDRKNDDMLLEFKANTYYDCRGIKDEELNEEKCQNKILNNYTCCRPQCCSRTNGKEINCYDYIFNSNDFRHHYKILLFNDEEILEDPKRKCTYFTKYENDINQKDLTNINLYKCKYNYTQLFLKYSNLSTGPFCIGNNCSQKYDCGIIDTKYHHLYAENESLCPICDIQFDGNQFKFYNRLSPEKEKIIIRNILSEIDPYIHEWKNYFVNDKTKEKISKMNIKEINKLFNKTKKYTNLFQKRNLSIPINLLINYYNQNEENKINKKEKINWYTSNYIGFGSVSDLLTFFKYFDLKDDRNNNLYKIGEEIYPSIESAIIGPIFAFLFLVYIFIIFFVFMKNKENIKKCEIFIIIIKQIILLFSFIAELVIYIKIRNKFDKINIDMDDIYKDILDLYNEKRYQILLLISVVFMGIAIICTIVGLILLKVNILDPSYERINESNLPNKNDLNNNINFLNNNNNPKRSPFNSDSNNMQTEMKSDNRNLIKNEDVGNLITNNNNNNNNTNNTPETNEMIIINQNKRSNLLPSIQLRK